MQALQDLWRGTQPMHPQDDSTSSARLLARSPLRCLRASATLMSICIFFLGAEMPNYFQYEIPPFRLGRLRSDKLRYNCTKAGSDFYERYKESLCEIWAIERKFRS
jgi:hypothetical protein